MRFFRKLAIIFLLPGLCLTAAAQTDSLDRYRGLDSLLTQFYGALVHEPLEVKNAEMDALIAMCTDSLARQHVTIQILDHYRHARVMGEEAVAVHIYDEWIATGKVKLRGEFELLEVQMFADFNRHTLLGMTAPSVELIKPDGDKKAVPEPGQVSVMFFYDTACSKCRLETQLLPSVLDEVEFPMNFYAVYCGDDKESWDAFRKNFKIENKLVELQHFWDPEMDSDYQILYGVLGTPRMYFILEDGEIFGRRLEVSNLQQLIQLINISNGIKEE